jgi:hypothetical protein
MKHWMNRMNHGPMGGPFSGWGRLSMGSDMGYETQLAEALGISVDQLRAAQDSAVDNGIKQAVAEGELAPKQAERMLTWRKLRPYLNPEALAARVLEMTPDQMDAAMSQGKSLWDLAQERKLDFGTARERFLAAGKAAVQQAVADGAITQQQADEVAKMAGHRHGPGGRGGFGPMGFFGRGPGFGPWGFAGRHHGFGPMGIFGRGRCGGSWDDSPRSTQRTESGPPAVV